MLTNALRALINNSLKKALIGKEKEKKKAIYVLIVFSFSIKVISKLS